VASLRSAFSPRFISFHQAALQPCRKRHLAQVLSFLLLRELTQRPECHLGEHFWVSKGSLAPLMALVARTGCPTSYKPHLGATQEEKKEAILVDINSYHIQITCHASTPVKISKTNRDAVSTASQALHLSCSCTRCETTGHGYNK
jgi:hypothetical protein